VDHAELLRRLTINDPELEGARWLDPHVLSPETLALVRLAAMIAIDAPEASYGAQVDAAVAAGVGAAAVVDVLAAVVAVVGLPRAVAAAPSIALALGLEPVEGWAEETGVER
jgi:4-carboxymuconolactone decarboxylase